ncbi:MAG: putative permease [Actinomycetia bacterium]|nr:putative permease [Actinomycetes bacterium]
MSAPVAARARWGSELALGVRLSVAGGRSGWVRLAMISLGVGLGVAMLFLAATLPAVTAVRDARVTARTVDPQQSIPRAADTLLTSEIKSEFRGRAIYGQQLQPEGDRAPLPPGVSRRLAPGEMVVSPALGELLASGDGALLRDRWPARIVGTIGPAGLSGPQEYAVYLGTDRLTDTTGHRVRSFGKSWDDGGMSPLLVLLGVVGLVVLLLPVMIFVTTAVRFGGEARDRQLAALRLVGADAAMTRRIAAGETLAGALLGLAVGGLLYLAVGLLLSRFVPPGLSFYPSDFRPVPVLAVLVVVLVPVVAVLVTLSALRRVVVEPLGVVRRSGDRRRRLWWRLVLPVAGLALLYPMRNGLSGQSTGFEYQVMAGVAALLVGVALLLPWVVDAVVRRLGGGSVAWQLAVRRLQLDSGTAVRAVSGIAVSVAGAIALQGLLAAVEAQFSPETGRDTAQFQSDVMLRQPLDPSGSWVRALRSTPGVRAVGPTSSFRAAAAGAAPDADTTLTVGDCDVLRLFARLDSCADGDSFIVTAPGTAALRPGTYAVRERSLPATDPSAQSWTLPAAARTVPAHADPGLDAQSGLMATPGALAGLKRPLADDVYVGVDPSDPDALDRVRNAAAHLDPSVLVWPVDPRSIENALASIRQGLLAGATALLLLIGASMLVNVAEQLRERRRLLAVLVAFGTRRATLTGSVLYQMAIPVALGLGLAVLTGSGLAMVMQALASAPISADWFGIGATSAVAALVVLLTTAASLPLLWRLTRPGGLRSE